MTQPHAFPTWEAVGGRGIRTLTNPERALLESLNPDLPTTANCITCHGRKTFKWYSDYIEPAPKKRKIVEYECQCIDQTITHRYLLYSGIGKAYQCYSWNDIGPELAETKQYEKVRTYCEKAERYLDAGVGMIFYGKPGVGKSMLGTMVAKHLLWKGYTAYFTTFSDMAAALKESWFNASTKVWFDHHVRNVGFLVIDDVGNEHVQKRWRKDDEKVGLDRITTATADSAIESIVRHRVQAALPTIITTNLDPEDMGARYDSASIVDLIVESSLSFQFENTNFRTKQRNRVDQEIDDDLTRPIVVR